MDYSVVLSPSARRDLRDIVRYISLDSPERAQSFGAFLISQTRLLAKFPEIGRGNTRGFVVFSRSATSRFNARSYCFRVFRYYAGPMPTVTVKLSEPEFSQLEAIAASSKRTKSDVLRRALAASAQATSASLLDAMRPYVGKLDGPGDLSTNKARMKRYGAPRLG